MVDIIYVKWGLANHFPDAIELNEALKEEPRLHDAILSHELGHKDENTFKQDFYHDLSPINKLSQKDLLMFMLRHPKTLTQFLPIYWSFRRKTLVYDKNMIVIYSFFLLIIVFGLIYLI